MKFDFLGSSESGEVYCLVWMSKVIFFGIQMTKLCLCLQYTSQVRFNCSVWRTEHYLVKSFERKFCLQCVQPVICIHKIKKLAAKCQQRVDTRNLRRTEGPLLDSCIFHDHITVRFASVSNTTLILLHSECFWGCSLFTQIHWLNIKQ